MKPSGKLPEIDNSAALFLDFDGTLVPIAAHPENIEVPKQLPDLLIDLARALDGALALVSGRSVDNVDGHLGHSSLATAGEHGAQIRLPDGTIIAHAVGTLARELDEAQRSFAGHDKILIEPKSAGFAIHYRQAPELQGKVRTFMNDLVRSRSDLEVIDGKLVAELRARGVSKGAAIDEFMTRQPFRGRTPVFVGDDVTDEDGFRTVNALGGFSIKVGDGQTCAGLRIRTIEQVYAWLSSTRDRLLGCKT